MGVSFDFGGDGGFSPSFGFDFGYGSDSGFSFGGGGYGGSSGFDFSSPGGAGFDFAGSPTSSFSAGPGVDLFGESFPDPTSEAYQSGGSWNDNLAGDSFNDRFGGDTFDSRFGAATDAIFSGQFGVPGDDRGDLTGGSRSGGSVFDTGAPPIQFTDNAMSGGSPVSGNSPFDFGGGIPGLDQPLTGRSMADGAGGLPGVGSRPQIEFSSRASGPVSGGGASGGEGGGTFLDKITQGAMAGIAKNPLGILASGAGLAMNLFKGNQDPEGLAQIRDAAANLQSTGSVLQRYLTTGTLPAGMQASVDAATKAARARIIGNHAQRGLSTDPTKNSALRQELDGLTQNAIITAATLGDKLMSQGLSTTGMANQLYQAIMKLDLDRSNQTSQAIANFAAALGGGGGQQQRRAA